MPYIQIPTDSVSAINIKNYTLNGTMIDKTL